MQAKLFDSSISNLPFLGLGISSSPSQALEICSARSQGVWEYNSIQFLNVGISSDTIIPPDLISNLRSVNLPSVIHLEEFNLVASIDESRLDKILHVADILNPLWLEQDLGFWIWEQVNLGSHMLNPILDEENLSRIVSNIKHIVNRSGIFFLAENPPIDFSVEEIDLLEFMRRLACEVRCGLVLDIGHFVGYCLATERDPFQYITNWNGIEHVVEIHLAGYKLYHASMHIDWFDRHSIPIPSEALDLLVKIIPLAKNLRAITLEQEGASEAVIRGNIAAVTKVVQTSAS